jgi:hypothetical protein
MSAIPNTNFFIEIAFGLTVRFIRELFSNSLQSKAYAKPS